MYQSHPNKDALFAGMPSNLVDATQNVESIRFDDLVEMRQVVWDLAAFIADWKPDLIPFFATGGIPYLIPVMHVLETKRQYSFIDGYHFHLYPGLTWSGTIEGNNSEGFFTSSFGDVVRQALGGEPLRVLLIDTTNSGNAVNKAVAACQKAFEVSGASLGNVTLKVIGIVNTSHQAAKRMSPDKSLVKGASQNACILTPAGFSPSSTFIDRQFTTFSPLIPGTGFTFEVAYWLAGNIPTEDNAELIGVVAIHELLSTTSEATAGRLKITYGNGESQQGTGTGNLSGRLISLLSMSLDSTPWKRMQATHDLLPLSDEERKSLSDIKEMSDGGLRLFELEPFQLFDRTSNDNSDRVNDLLKIGRLLSDVEVFWLGTLRPTPRRIASKVRASLEHGNCTDRKAVKYFRSAFPELTSADPGGDTSAEWWSDVLSSLPKETFTDDEQAFTYFEDDTSDAIGIEDKNTDSVNLALDFVVIVGGVEEARNQLCDLKSKRMSLEEIEKHLETTWPIIADKALKFTGPTNEQVAMNFVLESGGWDEANSCLERWIAKESEGIA